MSQDPVLLMGAETMTAVGAGREVLIAIVISPVFMRRAYELRRLCRRYVLDCVDSPILGELVYVDTAPGSPLSEVRDITWTWEAMEHSQQWRLRGAVGPEHDCDFVTVATSPFVEVELLQKLRRSKRRYLFSDQRNDPLWSLEDRTTEAWQRLVALDFTLPEPFGYLGSG